MSVDIINNEDIYSYFDMIMRFGSVWIFFHDYEVFFKPIVSLLRLFLTFYSSER